VVRKVAGNYLAEMESLGRCDELDLFWEDCLLEARFQYLSCGELDLARMITDTLSSRLILSGFYDRARLLNMELPGYKNYPSSMNWIARTYLKKGDYDSAKKWYQCSKDTSEDSDLQEYSIALHGLATIDFYMNDYDSSRNRLKAVMEIQKKNGDLVGEAATWHALATINLYTNDYNSAYKMFNEALKIHQRVGDQEGEAADVHALGTVAFRMSDYCLARKNYLVSLKIRKQIGDIAGVASAFFQLGRVAWRIRKLKEGLKLMAIGYMIFAYIDHADEKVSNNIVSAAASQLSYSEKQVEALLKEVAESYSNDLGQSLLDAAFPKS
jgi:tetratricopeptide (TPR) repeat protein